MKKTQSIKKRGARLGQHFLKSPWAAAALAKSAHIEKKGTVLEIGPGKGALTKVLLAEGARVIAVEKDAELIEILKKTFDTEIKNGALQIISADIRDVEPSALGLKNKAYVLAANIPYYITGEIIRTFLTTKAQPHTISILIQKEVAQRIVNTKKESLLSLSVKAFGSPRIVAKVPKGNFSPPPSVDSAILCIEHISRDFFDTISEQEFFYVLHAAFASKRKKLSNNLSKIASKEAVARAFSAARISETARAEDVSLQGWKKIVQALQ